MTLAQPVPAVGRSVASEAGPTRLRQFASVLRAEWTKLWSVRSTLWSLLVTVAIIVGLGALFCAARVARANHLDVGNRVFFDSTGFSMNGIYLAQLAVGVLGVLVMSSEYATGQIRATFGATPQRHVVLAAKVLVFVTVVFCIGLASCFAAFFLGQHILSGAPTLHHSAIGDPGALRAVFGGAMYLAVLGALGVGLATLVRRTAGAIATLVGLLLILPILVGFLPSPWDSDIGRFLPLEAGSNIFRTILTSSTDLSSWTGFAVFCAYAAVSLALGAVLLKYRDA